MLRPCTESDASSICRIYNYFVRETVVTFEEEPVAEAEMRERIRNVTSNLPWLVWEEQASVVGFAYGAAWRARSAYRFSIETTIYIEPGWHGRGIGTRLYSALLEGLAARSVHCAIGAIALPNPASIALHEKLGFANVGHMTEVGRKLDRWVDVGYWELILRC